jgi:sodium-dependent phosphate cotransporter
MADDRETPPQPQADAPRANTLLAVAYLIALLFCFLTAIELMSKAIQLISSGGLLGGSGDAKELFQGVSNPFAGLALGVLFTVMVQSSSATTATIVAVVGSGALKVLHAVPMVMGANIGTTITNTLVSIGHVGRSAEFRRAFAAATVHDFFNLIMVAVLLPFELTTRLLSSTAARLTDVLQFGGAEFKSPIKTAVKTVYHLIRDALESIGLEGKALGVCMLILGLALVFVCLHQITSSMRKVLAGRIEKAMNQALEGNALFGIGLGVVITVAVQSSSITTSLLVPMCAAGVMTLEGAFPIMLGANIGTTVTALLASMAQDNPAALTIALVHLLFNAIGVVILYPIPWIRRIPLRLACGLAGAATRNRLWVLAYVVGMFVIIPLAGWLLWRGPN